MKPTTAADAAVDTLTGALKEEHKPTAIELMEKHLFVLEAHLKKCEQHEYLEVSNEIEFYKDLLETLRNVAVRTA